MTQPCRHARVTPGDLPAIKERLRAVLPTASDPALGPCGYCGQECLVVETVRPDERPLIAAALEACGIAVPAPAGAANEVPMALEPTQQTASEAIPMRYLR